MRRWMLLAPLLVVSLLMFLLAATARSDHQALLFATLGGLVPALGLVMLSVTSIFRWRRMARELGLVSTEAGAYPDLEGRYAERRLRIARRVNIYGLGPRLTTVLRLEGCPEVRLPGLVADAGTVRSILDPLLV